MNAVETLYIARHSEVVLALISFFRTKSISLPCVEVGLLAILVIAIFFSPLALKPVAHADSVIATIPISKSPIDFAFNPSNGNVYVTQASANAISVIDSSTNSIIKSIIIPNSGPIGAAYNPINKYVYVANDSGPVGFVDVIDPSTNALKKAIPVGDSPVQVIYNPFNGYIYATIFDSQRVDVIDPSTNNVIKSIPVGVQPAGLAYNANNHKVYVANWNQATSSVSVIDSTTHAAINIPLPGSPWRIAFDSNSGNMYVTLYATNKVAVIDVFNSVIATITMPVFPPFPGSTGSGTSLGSIAYNPFNDHVYVSYLNSQYVTVIDASTNTVTDTIQVGHYPFSVGYHPINHNIYVANVLSDTVSVIGTNKTITPIASNAVCPDKNVKHWDKIIFKILSPELALKTGFSPNTELDIKVLDDPHRVADIKQKVLNFLHAPQFPRNSIQILGVDYSIICSAAK